MRRLLALPLIPAVALAGSGPTWPQIAATTSWEEVTVRETDVGDVTVKKAEIAGLTCLLGVASSNVPPATLLAVATDIKGSMKWSKAGLSASEVLGGDGSKTIEYYQHLDVPGWTGANDRFWFLRGTIETSGSKTVFRWDRMGENGGPHSAKFKSVRDAHPDAIEPPTNVGGWSFIGNGASTRIEYAICSDTGGVLPKMVQYAAAKQTLPETVADLIREGKRRAGG